MLGKVSVAIFLLTILFVILAFNGLVSGYVPMIIPVLGVGLGIAGLKNKSVLGKLGVWLNTSIFILLWLWAYVAPMIFGET